MRRKKERITIKSEEEIRLMREAGKILAEVHNRLGEIIEPGISTLEIDRKGEEWIREFGCIPSLYHSKINHRLCRCDPH
ncbi:MAG: M24 family metallopeptidase [Eubacterium sp.]